MINKIINKNGNFYKLLRSIENHDRITVFGFTQNEQVSIFNENESFILYVAPSIKRANEIKLMFESINKKCEILTEPFIYNYSEINNLNLNKFYNVLYKILFNKFNVLIVSCEVLLNKLPHRSLLKHIKLNKLEKFNLSDLTKTLISFGYKKQSSIFNSAEFSVRGDILDIYPAYSSFPVRISFFDDEIEFIKPYDLNDVNISFNELNEIIIFSETHNYLNNNETENVREILKKELTKLSGDNYNNLFNIYNGLLEKNNNANNINHIGNPAG